MPAAHRAVVVEDDPDVRALLEHVLSAIDLDVRGAGTGVEALALVREHNPDLVTLDLSLPDADGVELCRRIREFSDAYVVMITGRMEEVDRLVGLEVGADDYMTKPVSPREVQARAAALLRRPRLGSAPPPMPTPVSDSSAQSHAGEAPSIEEELDAVEAVVEAGGGLVVVPSRKAAVLDGTPLPLTPTEVDLLAAMCSSPGTVWERGQLVREVWEGEFIESDFLVDVHVANLRRKLRRARPGAEWITTVGGTGYRFERMGD